MLPNESTNSNRFAVFAWRVTASHVISYFVIGLIAFKLLDYKQLFETQPYSSFMRPMNSAAVAAGPGLQVIRGIIFSLVLWPFKSIFLDTRFGWLKLWALLIGLCILSTSAAAPGSIEGFIYTSIPIEKQLWGYLEVIPQTLLFSLVLYYWYKYPKKSWNIIAAILVVIIVLISVLAVGMGGGGK
jgi:hypothetical protein